MIRKLVSILLAAIIAVGFVPALGQNAYADISTIDTISLTITPPSAGTGSTTATSKVSVADMTGIASFRAYWQDHTGVSTTEPDTLDFVEGQTYYAMIFIEPENGYEFRKGAHHDYDAYTNDYAFDGLNVTGGSLETCGIYSGDGRICALVSVAATAEQTSATWTVTFDKNGGSGSMEAASVDIGQEYEIPDCDFDPPGELVFQAWNTVAKGTQGNYGTWYYPGDKVTLTEDMTLYARWGDPLLSLCSYDNTNNKSMQGGKFTFDDEEGHYGRSWSYGCSNYTLVKGGRYSVAAAPDNGYKYLGLYKGKYISTAEHSQDAYPYMDQQITADRDYDFTVTKTMVICPVFEEAPLVNFVDIGNVWTGLDPFDAVPFTGEVNPNVEGLGDFIEIAEETWTSTDGASVISSAGPETAPVVGKTYEYSVKIAAKGENAFDPEAGFRFIYGGTEYAYDDLDVTFSQDNKTATISGFVPDKTVAAVDLKTAAVDNIVKKTYTGKGLTQSPVVKITVNGRTVTLKKGADYDVSYKNNVNAGTATMTITGIGRCTGSVNKTFKINPKSITPSVKLSATEYKYNGKARKPSVAVKNGSAAMPASSYSVTYASGRKNVGMYKVTVTMRGNYTGSTSVKFKINPKGTAVSSISGGTKSFTVKWKRQSGKMAKKRISGYKIQYSTNKKFKSGKTVTVAGYNKTSKAISGLKANKKYYVRVRTYMKVGKATYSSGWSSAKAVKTASPAPVIAPAAAAAASANSASSNTGYGTVYWTPNGEVYHLSRSCSTLSRSKTVYSGSVADSGKPRVCKVCGY